LKTKRIGQIKKLTRYPVKSMAGIEMDQTMLGWHGLAGDRRFGVRQVENSSGFPWLSASKLPELLLYCPCDFDESSGELLPTRVQTPSGDLHEIGGNQLRHEIGERIGCKIEIMTLKHGIFDDSPISLIATTTVSHIYKQAGIASDNRRFRANIVVNLDEPAPFAEDDWIGRVIGFGKDKPHAAIYVTKRDVRCKMIGLDPDTAEHDPSVVMAAVELNENNAGVYGTVVCTGTINFGDSVFLLDG
jgi:uncharacterized protein